MNTTTMNLAETLVAALRKHGVERAFGIPGGGSSLALMSAFENQGIDFVLTAGETPAAIMAAVTGLLTGSPGVVMTGVGPGAACAVNGMAYAALERAPLLLLADAAEAGAEAEGRSRHQVFDQSGIFAPLAKARHRLRPEGAEAAAEALVATALAPPQGPVFVEMDAADAEAPAAAGEGTSGIEPPSLAVAAGDSAAARDLLANARRPLVIVGLQARPWAAALAELLRPLGCPVMLSYQARGVVAADEPHYGGLFTGANSEVNCLAEADLLVLLGLDPVEPIPGPWRLDAPLLVLAESLDKPYPVEPAVTLVGALPEIANQVLDGQSGFAWTLNEIATIRQTLAARVAMAPEQDLNAATVVAATVAAAQGGGRSGGRYCVDSGAHMFSAMALCPAEAPFSLLKSNGLSTMGFALPAALAAALDDPQRPVTAFTGDGGLIMCLGELATAARLGCRLVLVVLNDGALSMIDVKQQRQQRHLGSLRYPRTDFASTARGLGWQAWRAEDAAALESALAAAYAAEGPALVDAVIDPAAYAAQFDALRG
jgi:acetolactate synthase-1/2/3 large subunit